jgi:hypothetical protein
MKSIRRGEDAARLMGLGGRMRVVQCTVRIAHQKAKQQQPKQNGEPPMPKAVRPPSFPLG